MGFVNRRKQPAKFRSNPFPTPEQILTGVVVGVAENAIAKALSYFGRNRKGDTVAVEHKANAQKAPEVVKAAPKKKAKKKAKVSKQKE